MKQILLFIVLVLVGTAAIGQTIEKSQSIVIYDVVPTVTPCQYCSEMAFVRADSSLYYWQSPPGKWSLFSKPVSLSEKVDSVRLEQAPDSSYVVLVQWVDGAATRDTAYVSGGSGGGGNTNLTYTTSPTNGTVNSSTGTDATIPAGSDTNASLMLPGDKTKLDGIEAGATSDQTASEVSIADAGGFYTGTEVESALQEVGDSITDLRSDLQAVSSGASDGYAQSGVYDALNDEVDYSMASPANDFSIDLSALAEDQALADSTAQVRSEIPTIVSELTNDAGYLTSETDANAIAALADTSAAIRADFPIDTQLSNEEVEDIAGGMVGNFTSTQTRITVDYNDPNGGYDFTVEGDLSQYDNSTTLFVSDPEFQDSIQALRGDLLTGDFIEDVTDGATVDLTKSGNSITAEVILDNTGNQGLQSGAQGIGFNADGANTYDPTGTTLAATTLQDGITENSVDIDSLTSQKLDTVVFIRLNDSTFVAHNYVGGIIVRSDTISGTGGGGSGLWTQDGNAVVYTSGTDTVSVNNPLSGVRLVTSPNVGLDEVYNMLDLRGPFFDGSNQGRTLRAINIEIDPSLSNTKVSGIKIDFSSSSGRFEGLLESTISQEGGPFNPRIIDIDHTLTSWPNTSTDFFGDSQIYTFPSSNSSRRNQNLYARYTEVNSTGEPNTGLNSFVSRLYGHRITMNTTPLADNQQATYALYITNSNPHADEYGIYQSTTQIRNYFGGRLGIKVQEPEYPLDIAGSMRLNPHTTTPTGALGVQWVNSGGYYLDHDGNGFLRRVLMENAAPTDGDLLEWNATNTRWEAVAPTVLTDMNYTLNANRTATLDAITNYETFSATPAAASDYVLTLPSPGPTYEGKQVVIYSADTSGTYNLSVTAGTTEIRDQLATVTSLTLDNGETNILACMQTGAATYKWVLIGNR